MKTLAIALAAGSAVLGGLNVASGWDSLPTKAPAPPENPTTPAKAALGKQLYFDPRISRDNTVSCATCHDPNKGGVDGLQFSVGVGGKKGGRNAPTVLNAAFLSAQFWDGRAASLEDQAIGPMVNPVEMAMDSHDLVVRKLQGIAGYKQGFKAAFGDESITITRAAQAIAAYERTLITPSPYDKFAKGDKGAISAQAQRGLKTAQEVGCLSCHGGPNFAGPPLPVGTGFFQKFPMFPDEEIEKKYGFAADAGRFEATRQEGDRGFFRVQSWRNVAKTAPYFHNGSVATLDEAVRVMAKLQLNKRLTPEQTQDIVAFLETLTGELPAQERPELPQ